MLNYSRNLLTNQRLRAECRIMKRLLLCLLLLISAQMPSGTSAYGSEGAPPIFLPLIYVKYPSSLQWVETQWGGMDLWYPYRAILSPDEQFLYVGSERSNTIVALQRDAITGSLSLLQKIVPGPDTGIGVGDVPLVMSPDGRHMYASVSTGLALLTRDPATGGLQTTHIYSWNEEPYRQGVEGLALSPDGSYLYIVQLKSIAVLKRNPQDGLLQYMQTYHGDDDFPFQDTRLNRILISHDGSFTYIVGQNQLFVFSRNIETGELAYLDSQKVFPENSGPVWIWDMQFDREERFLYVCSAQDHFLGIFRRDVDSGLLHHVQSVQEAGSVPFSPAALTISPDSQELIVANSPNTLLRFRTPQANDHLELVSEQTVEPSPHDHPKFLRVLMTGDGRNVYVTSGHYEEDDHVDGVLVFRRNTQSGLLTFRQLFANADVGVPGLWGAEDIAVSPDGRHVYVTSIWENALLAFARNPQNGTLRYIDTYWNDVDGIEGLDFPRTLALTADGGFVLTGSNHDGRIAVFQRDSQTGRLHFVRAVSTGLRSVSWLTLSPDDAFVYAVGYDDDNMRVLSFDQQSGALSPVQTVRDDEVHHAVYVSIPPDGKHAYVGKRYTTYQSYKMLVYDRDIQTGRLTFKPSWPVASDTSQIVFSADGRQAYVGSYGNDWGGALFVHERNPESGTLRTLQVFRYRSGNLTDFKVISGVAISPDGRFVLATSQKSAALHVFVRDQQTGMLTWREMHKNGSYGIDSLKDASTVAISPDSKHAYVASVVGTITVFEIAGSP